MHVRTRIRRSAMSVVRGIAAVVETGTVKDTGKAMQRALNVPAVFSVFNGGRSRGRIVANRRRKLMDIEVSFIVVADDYFSEEESADTALEVIDEIIERLDGFLPDGAAKPLDYERDDFVMTNGERVAYEIFFSTKAEILTTERTP
jgi:hypothetical protein